MSVLIVLLFSLPGVYMLIMLIFYLIFGIPLVHFELSIGYLSKLGPVTTFSKMTPVFRGNCIFGIHATCILAKFECLCRAHENPRRRVYAIKKEAQLQF